MKDLDKMTEHELKLESQREDIRRQRAETILLRAKGRIKNALAEKIETQSPRGKRTGGGE